jgi:hypothetical protein
MRRFASATEEVNVILYNRSSEKTKNSIKAAVACFREFLRSEAADDQFETFAESTLWKFYCSARPRRNDGTLVNRSYEDIMLVVV